MISKRVVVTGLGAITPIGNTTESYWENLIAGTSGAAPITLFDASSFKTQFACEVKGFNPEDFIDKKEARRIDRFSQLALACSDQAIIDAGFDLNTLNKDKVGVIWSSGIGGLTTFYEEVMGYSVSQPTPRFNPFFIPKMIADIAAGHISIKHGFRGPNFCVISACASSNNAIMDAVNYIRLGKANVFVTGGSEAVVNQAAIGGFNAMKALSEFNENPAMASRPFDKTRDGFVLGEGAGALVLEEYEHAIARGARIYAEVLGSGASADAYHITAPHPEGEGVILTLNSALEDAELSISDIDYINVHGTSTPLGDIAELTAIQKVFGEHAYNLNISSTKSMTGHLLGAAGAIEAIATILTVKNDIVPPTINHTTADEAIDPKLNLTLNTAQKRVVNYAMSNTFGFGGHNCSVVFKKYN
jgi:3-oxoacyl-[acyl-carrier-protein] synthase II